MKSVSNQIRRNLDLVDGQVWEEVSYSFYTEVYHHIVRRESWRIFDSIWQQINSFVDKSS